MSTEAHGTSPKSDDPQDHGLRGELAMGQIAGDGGIANAPMDRARLIELAIASQEAVLNRLRKEHEGKPGRWK